MTYCTFFFPFSLKVNSNFFCCLWSCFYFYYYFNFHPFLLCTYLYCYQCYIIVPIKFKLKIVLTHKIPSSLLYKKPNGLYIIVAGIRERKKNNNSKKKYNSGKNTAKNFFFCFFSVKVISFIWTRTWFFALIFLLAFARMIFCTMTMCSMFWVEHKGRVLFSFFYLYFRHSTQLPTRVKYMFVCKYSDKFSASSTKLLK